MNSLGGVPKKRKVQNSMDRMRAAGRTNRGDNVTESLRPDPEEMKKLDTKYLVSKPVRDVADNLQSENNANIIASNMEKSLKGYIPQKGGRTHRYFEGKKNQKVETEIEMEVIKANDSDINEEGDAKYIVKTKGDTAYFPGAIYNEIEEKSSNLSYNKEQLEPVPSRETYKQKVARVGEEYTDKLNNWKKENKGESNLGEFDMQESISEVKKEKSKNKKEKVSTKTIKESVRDLQNKNTADLLEKNMQMMQDLPLQPSKIADKFKTMDGELIAKMNKGEDISKDLNNLNALGNIINKAQDPKEKESLLKQYNQLQKEVINYNEANKKVESDIVDSKIETKSELSENISVYEEGLHDKNEENNTEIKPGSKLKNTVEELVAEPTVVEAEVLQEFTQSVSNHTSSPTSQPKVVVEKKVVSPTVPVVQENIPVQQEAKTEKEEVKEILSNFDDAVKKRAEEILAAHGVKDKKSENGEGGKEKKKGFWSRLWNGTREGLKKRDDRLNSPELKKKYEELNASLEKDIGKVGNKSLTIIGDALFGNFLKGIKDGIISNKNWSGAIGEAVGSIVTRYLNSVYNAGEVVVHLVKALGKKTFLGARSLVGK